MSQESEVTDVTNNSLEENGPANQWQEEHSQLQADRGQSAFSQTNNDQSSFVSRSPDTDHPTRWQRRQAKQYRSADSSDKAQTSEAQQSQFIYETIEILVSAKRQTGFRRSWRFLHHSAMMRKSGPECSEDCGDVAG